MSILPLLDARSFPDIAAINGIRKSARTLYFEGVLTPITVGRRTYYLWRDVLPLMPESARRRYTSVSVEPVASGEHRSALDGHTVTLEHATRLTALRVGVEYGAVIVVERMDGDLTVPAAIPNGDRPVKFARAYASSRGARYVAGGAR